MELMQARPASFERGLGKPTAEWMRRLTSLAPMMPTSFHGTSIMTGDIVCFM